MPAGPRGEAVQIRGDISGASHRLPAITRTKDTWFRLDCA